MLFNSLHFVLFFPLVTALYFLLPHRLRWALLLVASCYFYMVFRPVYILILVFTIMVDYFAGIAIEPAEGKRRKWLLVASIVANVGALAIFKYYNFLNENLRVALGVAGVPDPFPYMSLILPIGLSFHVFQSLSYTIEVYRRRYPAERHLGYFAVYVMYYPQLVAGPIERPQNLLRQFRTPHRFEYHRVVGGLQQMLFGMFKKVVIADRLAPFVNQVYDHPYDYAGISLIIATVCFAFQIYCDFSGYSDIALGSSQVMGIRLMKNFDSPYLSQTIAGFWKRWHISLSTWFRDYLYISLGGSRVGRSRHYVNLMLTFLVSGLWHGANWTYVIWGGLNGLYLIGETLIGIGEKRSIPAQVLGIVRTFCLTCLAWIFFRARSLPEAWYVLTNLFHDLGGWVGKLGNPTFVKTHILLGQTRNDAMAAVAFAGILVLIETCRAYAPQTLKLAEMRPGFRWAIYYAGVMGVLYFGAFTSSQQFIYFQF